MFVAKVDINTQSLDLKSFSIKYQYQPCLRERAVKIVNVMIYIYPFIKLDYFTKFSKAVTNAQKYLYLLFLIFSYMHQTGRNLMMNQISDEEVRIENYKTIIHLTSAVVRPRGNE